MCFLLSGIEIGMNVLPHLQPICLPWGDLLERRSRDGGTRLFAAGNYLGAKASGTYSQGKFNSFWDLSTAIDNESYMGFTGYRDRPDGWHPGSPASFGVACGGAGALCRSSTYPYFTPVVDVLCGLVRGMPELLFQDVWTVWAHSELWRVA
jgi:hypothetical protein